MTNDDFLKKILEPRLLRIKETLCFKSEEYGATQERFANFVEIAKYTGKSPEENALTLMLKGFVNVVEMCQGDRAGIITELFIDEKIGDVICYLILIEGILKEKYVGDLDDPLEIV